jgi:phosphoribosyl-AMP cyclohydrolase
MSGADGKAASAGASGDGSAGAAWAPAGDAEIASLLAAVKFGADGLATAVAADHADGTFLMLAHMNRESLERTLRTGIMTYWSRSRKSLWIKGETSGNTQRVVSAHLDCDGDALLFRVIPQGAGAACHEGYRSCFFRMRKGGAWEIQGRPIAEPG